IFLATDGADVADEFQLRFGEQLVVRPKWMSQEPHKAGPLEPSSLHKRLPGVRQPGEPSASVLFRDAVVEMYLLARCDTLFYQPNSSFSIVAALFGRAAGHDAEPWGEDIPTLRESLFQQMLTGAALQLGSR